METDAFQEQVCFSMVIAWTSDNMFHNDHFYVHRMNTWRDLMPGSFLEQSLPALVDGPVTRTFDPGELLPAHDPALVRKIPGNRLDMAFDRVIPGRFYPQGMVRGLPGVFRGNMIPFRCLGKNDATILGDFNHALAGIPLTITLTDLTRHRERVERGGACTDWMDTALTGPGMQARNSQCPDLLTDLNEKDFQRADPSPDDIFYGKDRFVHHADTRAVQTLTNWYAGQVSKKSRVLDLMAGWASHLPDGLRPAEVHGIGLNSRELWANNNLTGFTVQDLNRRPVLDFPDSRFDTVICSLSVEYLTDPVAVFKEVCRVLVPGGRFTVSFSGRWFPEKVIALWPDLHEFERLGLVLDFFRNAGGFRDLSTVSFRGYPRPVEDRYYPELRYSDPVFGVTGRTYST